MKAILRNAYTATRKAKVIRVKPTSKRSGYTYKVKTRTYRVRATPVPDVGAAGKGPKLIGKLKGGMLTKYGYHPVESRTARERALMRAVKNGRENPDHLPPPQRHRHADQAHPAHCLAHLQARHALDPREIHEALNPPRVVKSRDRPVQHRCERLDGPLARVARHVHEDVQRVQEPPARRYEEQNPQRVRQDITIVIEFIKFNLIPIGPRTKRK